MNHNLRLLQSLYLSTSGKYWKLKARFDKAVHNGRFRKLNKRKQSFLVSRLKKLFERLRSLQTQLRLAGAAATLALGLSLATPAHAQMGPFERNDEANPLAAPRVIQRPRPAAVDIDDDGDLDVFVGNFDGDIQFFRNESPEDSVTRFVSVTGTENPVDGINEGYQAAPAFVDVDNDGDFDLLLGNGTGDTFFFRNTGSASNPTFVQQTGASNPFDGIQGTGDNSYGHNITIPTFVDLDGDTDMDLIIGSSYMNADGQPYSAVQYFENTAGVFSEVNDPAVAAPMEFYSNVALAFADVDGDDDLDMFAGAYGNNNIIFFKQGTEGVFTASFGTWDSINKTGNPFSGKNFGKYASPVAADFDGDGDIDFLVGCGENSDRDKSNIRYFENVEGTFSLLDRTQLNLSPFGGLDVDEEAAPAFVDLDGDLDLDVIVGAKYVDEMLVLLNENGKFVTVLNHPLVGQIEDIGLDYQTRPIFVDIDGDGDQDLFVCDTYGEIGFLRNNEGDFEGESSPLDISIYDIYEPSLAFVDVDDDGDFDALVGEDRYANSSLHFFRNNGTSEEPDFVADAAPAPFDYLTFEDKVSVLSVDLDNDGDTDLIVTETYYGGIYGDDNTSRVLFFENAGDGTFNQNSDPLVAEIPRDAFTSFADIDKDGDLDAFVGMGFSMGNNEDGRVFYYENTNPAPVTDTQHTTTVVVSGGNSTVIAPGLTIEDEDDDDIVQATVTISDFVSGSEELGFTEEDGINGEFDDEAGVLTFVGRASIETYQNLLRSVTLNFTGDVPGGRMSKAARNLSLDQTITFQTRDTDFTLATILAVQVVSIEIVPGTEITVFNAVSPNKDDNKNSFLRIASIETVSPENKVTIYNRWGDIVFDVKNYNNSEPSKRFEGVGNNGKDLPTGTYFYRIETTGKTFNGYLSLKR